MRQRPAIQIGDFSGGIDTFADSGNKALDATNMYFEGGRLQRRPAYQSFMAGPVHFFPAARCIQAAYDEDVPELFQEDLRRLVSPNNSVNYIYVGCTEQFDGFDWGDITNSTVFGANARNTRLEVEFWNGTTWVSAGFILDTTLAFSDDTATSRATLARNGRVHWHALPNWAEASLSDALDGEVGIEPLAASLGTAYWVRFRPVIVSTDTVAWNADWTMAAPGIRVFQRAAINGIFQLGVHGGLELIACADRVDARGHEQGCAIGVRGAGTADVTELNPVTRWSSGTWGAFNVTAPRLAGAVAVPTSIGTVNQIIDTGIADGVTVPSTLYLTQRPFGAYMRENIVPTVASTANVLATADAVLIEQVEHALEHHRLEFTTSGGGATAGEIKEITSFEVIAGVAYIGFDPEDASGANATARCRIIRPPMKVALRGQSPANGAANAIPAREYDTGGVSPSARVIIPNLQSFSRVPTDVFGVGQAVNIEIREPARFNLPAGRQYSSLIHPLGKRLILANGGPLLSYDGTSLERLKALPADHPLAESWLSFGENEQSQRPALYDLRFHSEPPAGKYLATMNGYVLVAGTSAAPNRVQWSAGPHDFCDLWPLTNNVTIRDNFGGPITGMMTYYDRVIVFTARSIHEGRPDADGRFNFRAVTNSIGFVSGHTVRKVAMNGQDVLMGAAIDGLIAWAGGEPTYLIDRWDRVFKHGIDLGDMERGSAAVWQQEGYYFQTIRRRAGGADASYTLRPGSRDTILVHDYVNNRSWNWQCPFGVNRLETLSLPNGRDVLAIGTEDGFICTLVEGRMDDGIEYVGSSVRSLDVNLAGGRRVNLTRVNLTVNDLGVTDPNMGVEIFLDGSNRPYSDSLIPFNSDQEPAIAEIAESVQEDKDVTMPMRVRTGTKARSISVELYNTRAQWELSNLEIEVDLLTAEKR